MHAADLRHPTLEDRLHAIYNLNRGEKIAMGFRPQYLNLLRALGDPHKKLPPVIHVAGTNGKGSVIAMLRAALEEAGYTVHIYTSPHLYEFNERIRLAGKLISNNELEELIDYTLQLNKGADLTFFEATTAIAFAAFAKNPADILLLETGLGGRLDCTNVIEEPLLTVITPVSFDHTEFLGRGIDKIAAEKAGIMKRGVPCITARQTGSAMKVLREAADRMNVALTPQKTHDFTVNLTGAHQIENAGIALAALESIAQDFPVTPQQIHAAFQKIEWPARLEKISSVPEIWYDGGHNEGAAIALASQLAAWQAADNKPLHLILGIKADKDASGFLEHLLPFAKSVQLVDVPGIESIQNLPQARYTGSLLKALKTAAGKDSRVLVSGSLYLAAPLQAALKALS